MLRSFNLKVYKYRYTAKGCIRMLFGVIPALITLAGYSQAPASVSFDIITELIDSGHLERAENHTKAFLNAALLNSDFPSATQSRYYLGRVMDGMGRKDEALVFFQQAYQDSIWLDPHDLFSVKFRLAQFYHKKGEVEMASSFYTQVLEWSEKKKDYRLKLSVTIGLGQLYMKSKDYHKAVDYLEEAYRSSMRLNYHDELGKVFFALTDVYFDHGSYTESKRLAFRTLNIAHDEQLNDLTMGAYYVLGNIHFDQFSYDSALFYFKKAYDNRSKDFFKNVATVSNIAESYYELGQYDSGKLYTDRAIALVRPAYPSSLHTFDLQLAKYYYSKDLQDSAYYYAISFRDKAHNSFSHRNRRDLYKFLYRLAKEEGNIDSALRYHEIFQAEKDSVLKRLKERDLTSFRVKLETLEKQMTIDHLQARSGLDRLKLIATISFSLLVVIASVILILYLKGKNRGKTLELDNSELERKNIQNELGLKEKELADTTLVMVKKNQFLDELDIILKNAKNEINGSALSTWHKLQKALELNRSNEKEWDDFNKYFGNVHNEFFDKLKNQYPALSAGDLRHCALIRMNMSHKESAKILGIDPNSVKMARYRMKKKIGLDEAEDLGTHIHSI